MKGKTETIVTCEFTYDGKFNTDDMGELDYILKRRFSDMFNRIADKTGASHVTIKTQNFLHEEEERPTYADHFFKTHPNAPRKKAYCYPLKREIEVPTCTRRSVYGIPGETDPGNCKSGVEWLEPYPVED